MITVVANGWGVSYMSGSDIDGLILNVYRFGPGPRSPLERCSDCDGRRFPVAEMMRQTPGLGYCDAMDRARDEASAVALAHGHLQEWHHPDGRAYL